MKILVIDDEPDVAEVVNLCFTLQWPGSEVAEASTGNTGIDMVESVDPDLVILDIALPDLDGFGVCKSIREFSDVPIIMLTARDQDISKIKGLEVGADDYITKPFNHLELLARAKAVLRRSRTPQLAGGGPPFVAGDLCIDFGARQVTVAGAPVQLTATEYNLLYHLARNAGHVLTHRTLLAKVWGHEYLEENDYLKVYVRHLRQKLGDDAQNPRYIVTERGVGYRMARPA